MHALGGTGANACACVRAYGGAPRVRMHLGAHAEPESSRRAHTEQLITMMPWQMSTDVSYWHQDALDRWKAREAANVLQIPPMKPLPPPIEATISGPHASSVAAWRESKVPLSQWEM